MFQTPQPGTLRSTLLLLLLVGAMALVGACEDDVAPTKPKADEGAKDEKKDDKVEGAKKSLDKGSTEEYVRPEFPGQVRRDPFVFEPPRRKLGGSDGSEERVKEPLENFDIGSLTLVAIVTGTAVPTAMFTDGTKFGHIAKEGDRIGRDGGRITDIRSNEVEVTINAKRSLSSDEELEEDGEDAVEESDPVTIVILLTDTDLELPSEIEEGEQDIEDELERDDGSAEVPSADQ